MSVSISCVPSLTSNRNTLELYCTKCDSYFGWYPDTEAGYSCAKSLQDLHESACEGITPSRVIANSGTESLQTAERGEYDGQVVQASVLERWSEVIAEKQYTTLPGRLAIALLRLDECNYDHDCGGEGDYPRCKECRAVRIMRGLIVELGAHGIGSEGLKP